jgi:dTDP-4-amino-4,6-dideoxygalactose transaminase
MLPYGRHSIDSNDLKIVKKSLNSKLITTGKFVEQFEKKISNYTKSKYAVSCNSGTSALHLAFISANIKKGDAVIVPAINFIATCNILKLIGAKIYICDVNEVTGQITPELIIKCIKKNKIKKIKALVVMYLGGNTYFNYQIYSLKKKYKFLIIEDSCHALGSSYKYNKKIYKIGSCKHSDIATFSFHPLKSITTGEGGAITTNTKKYAQKARLFRSHGIVRIPERHWVYEINSPGLNYRLSDINCSLGISQLSRIKKIINKRKLIAKNYLNKLKELNERNMIKLPNLDTVDYSSWHLFIIRLNFLKLKCTKEKLLKFFKKNKIYLQQHYIPVYKFNYYKKLSKKLDGTEKYFKNSISFPIFYDLSLVNQNRIIRLLQNFINQQSFRN